VDWDDLRYFLKVAETGGLSPAARFLRVNTATVGRHIEALEAASARSCSSARPRAIA
jgi:DNA-binding transcriptional LysR family regulator